MRLRQLTDRVGHVFARPEPRAVFHDLVEGLLSDLPKKNSWSLSERAGHSHPGRMQALLSRGAWSADSLEAEVRAYVIEHLGDPDATRALAGWKDDAVVRAFENCRHSITDPSARLLIPASYRWDHIAVVAAPRQAP